jgi:hypothetical protein
VRFAALVLLFACSSGRDPNTTNNVIQHVADPAPPEASVEPAPPIELTITEGTPVALPDGVTIDVTHLGYLHLADSQNVSHATVIAVRGAERVEVPLGRHHGGKEPEPDIWKPALGWEFQLVFSDPYHQPGSAGIKARRPR